MKKLVEMVRIFILSIVLAVIIIPNNISNGAPITSISGAIGNWYDTNGNLAFTISSDYKINGCQIMSVDIRDEKYFCKVNEGNQIKTMTLDLYDRYDYHSMLIINDNGNTLRKSKNPRYFESVGGIYLGMSKNQVVSHYGQPSSIDHNVWKYNKEGFQLNFYGNVVSMITIYTYGNRRFDWSGLSANSSKSDYQYKYNSNIVRGTMLKIGYGEVIYLYNNGSVALSIESPYI